MILRQVCLWAGNDAISKEGQNLSVKWIKLYPLSWDKTLGQSHRDMQTAVRIRMSFDQMIFKQAG